MRERKTVYAYILLIGKTVYAWITLQAHKVTHSQLFLSRRTCGLLGFSSSALLPGSRFTG